MPVAIDAAASGPASPEVVLGPVIVWVALADVLQAPTTRATTRGATRRGQGRPAGGAVERCTDADDISTSSEVASLSLDAADSSIGPRRPHQERESTRELLERTPAPPTPQPTPDPDSELIGACYGKPVKWAAPYAGKLHPLVIAGPWGIPDAWDWLPDFDVSEKWRTGEWTGPMIQLILCPYDVKPKPSGSCGTYTRDDGVRGELIRLRDVLKIRVVVARTGKTLQTATLLGPNATCPASKGVAMDEPPPWGIRGDDVTFDQMEEYAAKVLKQPVK